MFKKSVTCSRKLSAISERHAEKCHLLLIDFGPEIGTLKSSAQITERYAPADLLGRQVAAVVNFPAKQIGPLRSQCLVLGATPEAGGVVLLQPGDAVPNGTPVA